MCCLNTFVFLNKTNKNMVNTILPSDFVERYKTQAGIILDVRTASEYMAGHLQGARKADFLSGEFAETIQELDASETYYLYCRSGQRSSKAANLLVENGFEKVYNIGGYSALENAGFPTDYE